MLFVHGRLRVAAHRHHLVTESLCQHFSYGKKSYFPKIYYGNPINSTEKESIKESALFTVSIESDNYEKGIPSNITFDFYKYS